jgi:hypothetical protein
MTDEEIKKTIEAMKRWMVTHEPLSEEDERLLDQAYILYTTNQPRTELRNAIIQDPTLSEFNARLIRAHSLKRNCQI